MKSARGLAEGRGLLCASCCLSGWVGGCSKADVACAVYCGCVPLKVLNTLGWILAGRVTANAPVTNISNSSFEEPVHFSPAPRMTTSYFDFHLEID
jgi:hypothetical protein